MEEEQKRGKWRYTEKRRGAERRQDEKRVTVRYDNNSSTNGKTVL